MIEHSHFFCNSAISFPNITVGSIFSISANMFWAELKKQREHFTDSLPKKIQEQTQDIHNAHEIQHLRYTNDELDLHTSYQVNNCGLVLINNYIHMYFERLGLLNGNAFKHSEAQRKAVHYLQFLASGHTETEEHYLLLNKVLCGLDRHHPIESGIEMFEEETHLATGLLNALISHWGSNGSTTINGFRGNWLLRSGILRSDEKYDELIVEKKAYDLLLGQAPFTYSRIEYPWMAKPLIVTWTL